MRLLPTKIWLTICILLFPVSMMAQIGEPQDNYMFTNITDGLSSSRILCIYRDSHGFLWIGTDHGLNRYDAYHIQQYYDFDSGIPNNRISNIFEDYDGNIWMLTDKGYSFYDYQIGKFSNDIETIISEYGIPNTPQTIGVSINRNYLWCILNGKTYVYNHITKTTKVYAQVDSLSDIYATNNAIYTIDTQGEIISTSLASSQSVKIEIPKPYINKIKGQSPLIYIDNSNGIWVHSPLNSTILYKKSLESQWQDIILPVTQTEAFNKVLCIAEDPTGHIWINTSHYGAFVYNPKTNSFVNLRHDPQKSHTIDSNNLVALHIDQEGIVWLGNFKNGISYYNPKQQVILSYKPTEYPDISKFYEDKNNLWRGTDGGGLIRYSYIDKKEYSVPIPANVIDVLEVDSKGRMWLGCYQNGLFCYEQGKITQYTSKNSALAGDVYGLQEDENGLLYLGILSGKIQTLNPNTQEINTLSTPRYLPSVQDILYIGNDELLIATLSGLISLNTKTEEFDYFYNHQDYTKNLWNITIYSLYKDSRGLIWIGHTKGLTCWNREKGEIFTINHEDGLHSEYVTAVIEDNNGQMWIGTTNGISKINLSQSPYFITNYNTDNNLLSYDINLRSMYKLNNGNILFGTPNGFNLIVPQETIKTEYDEEVFLSNIIYPYQDISISDITNNKSPEYATEISLHESKSFIQLQFSTLNFTNADKTKYAYMIEGLNSNWIYATNCQIALSTLPIGKHKLLVKTQNEENIWSNKTKTLIINIIPPWYMKNFAFAIYIALIIILVWNIVSYFKLKQKKTAEIKKMERENETQQKLTEMKMQFFANVSHEFRTPLSLIINPLEEYITQNPQGRNSLLNTVISNAKYLLELVNQLLDFRKLDAKGESINYMYGNIVETIKDIYLTFTDMSKSKEIEFQISGISELYMNYDFDKIRKITSNLLSNAFKFTENKGSISIVLDKVDNNFVMRVIDSGSGIDVSHINHIFDCFYRSNQKDYSKSGTGIGLYLVSEYVKLHNGTVHFENNIPHGSIFTIILPIEDKSISHGSSSRKETIAQNLSVNNEDNYTQTILIADDNTDFLDFLSASLSSAYKVITANDGLEALNILQSENVDILISDVMMPRMDGLELCSKVRENILFSHIPIILLTAKSGEEYQLEGFTAGADEYIVKPFNMEILKLKIDKLIRERMDRQKTFDQHVNIEPSKITITPLDTQFIEKAIHIVETNFGNTNFSVDELAEKLNISRGYLYKKLIKITGKTPIEFIRIMRLKRAQQLLQESQLSISEIAFMLGYQYPKVFTRHFKNEFNITPSDYANQFKQEGK